jgi:large subunit ribosomal protein L18
MKNNQKNKTKKRAQRHRRIRKKIYGTASRPRASIFKSGKHIYLQIIDDDGHKTLAHSKDLKLKTTKPSKKTDAKSKKDEKKLGTKESLAYIAGQTAAEQLKKLGIKSVIFDKGGYKYHGRVKAIADGLRDGGIVV